MGEILRKQVSGGHDGNFATRERAAGIPDESVAALARTIGIDAAEIVQRRAFLAFDENDVRLLTEMRARWTGATKFVDRFYDYLVASDEIRSLLPDGASLERLKRAQVAYFDTLTAGDYGYDYALSRLRAGVAYRRTGLDPKWYLGAYSHYLCGMLPELWKFLGDDPGRFLATCIALLKVVFLDMGLASDTYVQTERRTILGLRRYAGEIIASLPNGLAVVDVDLSVLTVNDVFRSLSGLSPDAELAGLPIDAWIPIDGLREQALALIRAEGAACTVEGLAGDRWLRVTLRGIRLGEEEQEERLLVMAEDITEQRSHAQRIEELAFHDSLTGLPNRALFMERLEEALGSASQQTESFAVLYMDLDRFKEINDTRGHMVGNRVLREIAGRFSDTLRARDAVARLGGDEFALVATGTDRSGAAQIAARLQGALGEPLAAMEKAFSVGISIGIAMYPEHGRSADELYKHADIAMYRAKAAGGGYRFYHHEMGIGLDTGIAFAQRLAHAIRTGTLELYYQPQVSLRTGALTGAEALLRWSNGEGGWVSPAEFIPVAEERGMMGELGLWVIQAACSQLSAWRHAGLSLPGRLAFNVSAQQFEDVDLAVKIVSIVDAAGLAPTDFEIELTEGGLMKNVDESARILEVLKAAGFTFALDDFGSGYSSLTHLQRMPVDRIKIDISFVRDMLAGPRQRTMVAAIIGLARALGIQVLAEGAEQEGQVRTLRELGCDDVQGYWFGHPVPADEFARDWLRVCEDAELMGTTR